MRGSAKDSNFKIDIFGSFVHSKRRKLFFNSVVKRIRGIIKKKRYKMEGGEGKKVSTFSNDGHAKKKAIIR